MKDGGGGGGGGACAWLDLAWNPDTVGLSVSRSNCTCISMHACVCLAGYQQGRPAPLGKKWLWLLL